MYTVQIVHSHMYRDSESEVLVNHTLNCIDRLGVVKLNEWLIQWWMNEWMNEVMTGHPEIDLWLENSEGIALEIEKSKKRGFFHWWTLVRIAWNEKLNE